MANNNTEDKKRSKIKRIFESSEDVFDKYAWQFKNESEFEEEIDEECLDKDEIETIHFGEDEYP